MARKAASAAGLNELAAFAEKDVVHVIIDTPKGSRNKFKYDAALGLFKLSGVLPAGAVFPFDFGFVPSTVGGDGDALDVLVLMDEPAFVGCLVEVRLVGVIEAEQTEDKERTRNDRLIGVADQAKDHKGIRRLSQLNDHLVAEIEHFFVSYNEMKGKVFKPLGWHGPKRAQALVKDGVREFKKEHDKRKVATKNKRASKK